MVKFTDPTPLIPGKNDVSGKVDMDQTPGVDFIYDGPAYDAYIAKAHQLNQEYGARLAALDRKDPKQLKQYTALEKEVTVKLNTEWHAQVGDYPADLNPDTDKGEDVKRYDTKNPMHASEMAKGTFICRTDGPAANAGCAIAGLDTYRAQGFSQEYVVLHDPDAKPGAEKEVADGFADGDHVFVLSAATGVLIDFTGEGEKAYIKPINHPSLKEIEDGVPVLFPTGQKGHFRAYRHDSDARTPEEYKKLSPEQKAAALAREEASHEKANDYVKDQYNHYIEPMLNGLVASADKGDMAAVKDAMEKYPYTPRDMIPAFNAAVANHNADMVHFFIDNGVTKDPAFTTSAYQQLLDAKMQNAPDDFKQLIHSTLNIPPASAPAVVPPPQKAGAPQSAAPAKDDTIANIQIPEHIRQQANAVAPTIKVPGVDATNIQLASVAANACSKVHTL
jgi:hypothetical protein